jgi:type IV pilus assembly protein PilM
MKLNVAIDVGSYYVKVIVGGVGKKEKIFVKKIGYFPNPFPSIRSDLIEREQDIFVKTLKGFLHKNSIREKRTISNLGGSTVIHYFDIPKIPEDEIKPAVDLELMQVVPGGTKSLEYDYTLLPGKDGKQTVLFIGCQKDRCEFFTRGLQRVGLKPLIMDHNSLAVLNCFNHLNKKKDDTIFLLNIGYTHTNFVLAEKGGFVLIRDIFSGGKDITQAVADKKGISLEDAEIYASKGENASEIKDIVTADLEELLSEVATGMQYFRNRTEISPETLYLTGGVSLTPGLSETFEHYLKVKTVIWNPLENLDKDFTLPQELKKKGHLFTVSLGLLMREIR